MADDMYAPLRGPDARAIRGTLEEAIKACAEVECQRSVIERLGVMWADTWRAETARRRQIESEKKEPT